MLSPEDFLKSCRIFEKEGNTGHMSTKLFLIREDEAGLEQGSDPAEAAQPVSGWTTPDPRSQDSKGLGAGQGPASLPSTPVRVPERPQEAQ